MTKGYTKDYAITMQDSTGRVAVIHVDGATIDELIATGVPPHQAAMDVEDNSFSIAVREGKIGADAFLAPTHK